VGDSGEMKKKKVPRFPEGDLTELGDTVKEGPRVNGVGGQVTHSSAEKRERHKKVP